MAQNAAAQLSTGAATALVDPACKLSRLVAPGVWGLHDSVSADPSVECTSQTVCLWSPELHALLDCGVSKQQLQQAIAHQSASCRCVHNCGTGYAQLRYWLCTATVLAMQDTCFHLLFAGHDTSAAALTMLLSYLKQEPQVLAKLRQEQKEVGGSTHPTSSSVYCCLACLLHLLSVGDDTKASTRTTLLRSLRCHYFQRFCVKSRRCCVRMLNLPLSACSKSVRCHLHLQCQKNSPQSACDAWMKAMCPCKKARCLQSRLVFTQATDSCKTHVYHQSTRSRLEARQKISPGLDSRHGIAEEP